MLKSRIYPYYSKLLKRFFMNGRKRAAKGLKKTMNGSGENGKDKSERL
jgi:hypothetical protein